MDSHRSSRQNRKVFPRKGRPGSPRPFKVVSAGCIVYRVGSDGLEVLLGHRSDGSWHLPRGKALPTESPREAATREVLEETGLSVKPSIEVGSYTYPIGKNRYKVVYLYAATVSSGTPTPDGEEFVELRWSPIPDAISDLQDRDAVMVSSLSALFAKNVLR